MRYICVIFLVFLLFSAGLPGEAFPQKDLRFVSPRDQIKEVATFRLEEGTARVEMGVPFIVPGSDSLSLGGVPLKRDKDYRINNLKGVIILIKPVKQHTELKVLYSRYPFPFSPVFARRFPEGGEVFRPSGAAERGPAPGKGRTISPHRLRLFGSKTVGFSLGSGRGVGVDQSMRVEISGKLARDLEVEAFLTDDDMPIQPEGSTEELRHLEKVSIQIRSRHTRTRLGDLSAGMEWAQFSSYQRDLRGIVSEVNVGNQKITGGAGMTKGRFRRVDFFGREGVQGPYELLEARRFDAVVILSGTETVYLDGRRLRRGRENDYTIDYNRATVTFTEESPVTADSEIVVEFQTSEDNYERNTVLGGWEAGWGDGSILLNTSLFQEWDNPDEPLRGSLTDQDIRIIEQAGDREEDAIADGVERVGEGGGYYNMDPVDSVFVFAEDGGEYRVNFYKVGSGEGDYRLEGLTSRGVVKYTYVGEGEGDYAVGRPLYLPRRKRIFSMGARASRDHLFLESEGNLSLYDLNTLSGLDDDDNRGTAVILKGGLRDIPVSSSRLTITGEYSRLEDRFAAPDQVRRSYFYRDWNLRDVPLVGTENIAGAALNWESKEHWRFSADSRYLSRGNDLSATKNEVDFTLGDIRERGLNLTGFDSRVNDSRDRTFGRGEIRYALWHMVPSLSLESERYRNFTAPRDTGRYYYQGSLSLGTRETGNFTGAVSYTGRRTDYLTPAGGEWFRGRDNDEISVKGTYSGGNRTVEISVHHRETSYITDGASSTYDLAGISYRDGTSSGSVVSDLDYRLSSGEERRQEETVIYVGENQGDYDREGRQVGQKRGDYMVIYLPGSEKEALRKVELNWHLNLGEGIYGMGDRPEKGPGLFSLIRRNVSCDQFFSVLEKSTTGDLIDLYFLSPHILQRDDVTIYGNCKFRQEWSFLNSVKKYDLRLRFYRRDEEDNRSRGVPIERFLRSVRVTAEAAPWSRLTLSTAVESELNSRETPLSGDQNYRVSEFSVSQSLDYRLRTSTRISLEAALEKRNDDVSSAVQDSWVLRPSLRSSIGKKLSLNAYLKITYTDAESSERKPLFFMEDGLREDWSIMGQYRVTRNVSFGLNYTGRHEKDFTGEVKTVHDLKMESRAYF